MQPPESKPVSRNIVFVDTSRPVGAVRRDTQGASLRASGLMRLNANGSELWDTIVQESQMDPEITCVRLGADLENGVVTAHPAAGGTPGAIRVGRQSGRLALTMHLFTIFESFPQLSPGGNRSVLVSRETDAAGKPYMMIDLKTATVKVKGRRSSSSSSSAAPSEAG